MRRRKSTASCSCRFKETNMTDSSWIFELPVLAYGTQACTVDPEMTWQKYYSARNAILKALRPFGSVGPMGECLITDDEDGPPDPWPIECQDPDFYVIDDWLNDTQMILGATDHKLISSHLLAALVQTLKSMPPNWAILMDVCSGGKFLGGIQLFSDKVILGGQLFADVTTVEALLHRCQLSAELT